MGGVVVGGSHSRVKQLFSQDAPVPEERAELASLHKTRRIRTAAQALAFSALVLLPKLHLDYFGPVDDDDVDHLKITSTRCHRE